MDEEEEQGKRRRKHMLEGKKKVLAGEVIPSPSVSFLLRCHLIITHGSIFVYVCGVKSGIMVIIIIIIIDVIMMMIVTVAYNRCVPLIPHTSVLFVYDCIFAFVVLVEGR